jgi:hypothetical protein
MRVWAFMLGGILVWTADFFLLYAIASIFLTTPTARVLALIVSVAALAADAWLLWHSWHQSLSATDPYGRWIARLALLTAAISTVGVVWLGFPPVFA